MAGLLTSCAAGPEQQISQMAISLPSTEEGAPVTIPRAKQFDITSRINGRRYRIMVATPFNADPAIAYLVLYVLDGNQYFGTATEALTRQSELNPSLPFGTTKLK